MEIEGQIIVTQPLVIEGEADLPEPLNIDGEIVVSGTAVPGPPGPPGEDGVSPQVSVETITGGHRVTITDSDTTSVFDVMDGAQGEQGPQGEQGEQGPQGVQGETGATGPQGQQGPAGNDGVSPTVTTTAITGGTQVTITDGDGPHTFNVMDGAAGPQGPTGPQGPQGEQGPQGATGATGATGPQGPQGEKGDKGDKGQDADVDFTELTAPTISGGACTITFAANQRNGVEFSTNADLAIALVSNNKADNYMWITNSHATTAIDITFSSILFGSTTINDIKGTASIPSIEAGETLEIGIYVTETKARITSRIL